MTVAADADLPALVLSTPTGEDIDRIAEICRESDIQEWTFIPRGYQRSDAHSFVEQIVADGWNEGRELTWAVREAGDNGASSSLVGMLGITLSGPEEARTGEIGYWLTAAARGRGTMTRAVAALIDTAFDPDGPLGLSAPWCPTGPPGRSPGPSASSERGRCAVFCSMTAGSAMAGSPPCFPMIRASRKRPGTVPSARRRLHCR